MTQERLQRVASQFKQANDEKAAADRALEVAQDVQAKANFAFNGAKGELELAMYEFALFGIESGPVEGG